MGRISWLGLAPAEATHPPPRWVRPLDAVRRTAWGLSARTAWGRRCLQDRAFRLQVLALVHVGASLALTIAAPMWLLLLGPLLLGVPHVASELRMFVLEPPFELRSRTLFLAPLVAMVAARTAAWFGGSWSPAVELAFGWLASGLLLWLVPLPLGRRLAASALVLAAFVATSAHASSALLVFAHLHNVIALVMWLALYRRQASWGQVSRVALAWLVASALVLSGALDGAWQRLSPIGGLSLGALTEVMAPGLSPVWATRLVMLFAFAQSVHYAVWIRLVPQTIDPRRVPPTFARSVVRLRSAWGPRGLWLLAASAVAFPALALVWDAEGARLTYLVAVVFHGWLEVAVIVVWVAGALRPLRGR